MTCAGDEQGDLSFGGCPGKSCLSMVLEVRILASPKGFLISDELFVRDTVDSSNPRSTFRIYKQILKTDLSDLWQFGVWTIRRY